jgi:hypothetical protein
LWANFALPSLLVGAGTGLVQKLIDKNFYGDHHDPCVLRQIFSLATSFQGHNEI